MIQGHGDDRYRYGDIRADFSSNIPGGIDHTALMEHLAASLSLICRYPEPEPYTLEGELAARLGLDSRQVLVTAGATEAIYLVADMLARRNGAMAGGSVVIAEPTFAEYGDACRLRGIAVEAVDSPFDPPARCRAVWCCNPDNPTGRVWDRNRLMQTIDNRPDTLFVIDRSYDAFTLRPTMSPLEAAARTNVISIHSMTKRYAIPGLRLGYIVASRELCGALAALRMPWSVNALAIEAGLFLLAGSGRAGEPEGVHEGFSLPAILSEAARLAGEFTRIGSFSPQPTDTHFFLVEMAPGTGTAAELKDRLARECGILIRNADNFRGLSPRHFRVAAQSPSAGNLLIEALTRWPRL